MNSGMVISFDPGGAYGFIRPADEGLKSVIEQAHLPMLRPGQAVDYELTWNLAGTLLAIDLRLRSAEAR
jgi:cold shock CspA family protein